MELLETKDLVFVVGIILSFILGVWNIFSNYRLNKRTTFINTVTAERVKWIDNLRNNISKFCGLIHTWRFSSLRDTPKEHEVLADIDKLRYLIRLQLNLSGEHDKKIEELMTKIPDLTGESQINELKNSMDDLVKRTQLLLKKEWEKAKEESSCV